MSMFVTSLLNFIFGYKMFMGINKKFSKKRVRLSLCITTYYNLYF